MNPQNQSSSSPPSHIAALLHLRQARRRLIPTALACLLIAMSPWLTPAARAQVRPDPYTDSAGLPEDEPQSKRINALIEAVNAGDRDGLLAFFAAHLTPQFQAAIPAGEHADILLELHRTSGAFHVHGLRRYDPPRPATNRTVIVRNTLLETWEAFVLEFEPGEPHRIDRIGHSQARAPKGAEQTGPLTWAQASADLTAYLDRLAAAELHSGVTLIAKDGEIIFTHVCGQASKAFDAPNTIDTKFNLGSMNKMFTATAIAQLVEKGTLNYDDTIDQWLGSDWIAPAAAAKIRIGHLLSHTSGLGSYFNEKYWNSSRELYRSVNDFKPLVVNEMPAFEPGTDWQYSNTGFLLLGAVIEKVTGRTYFDHVREAVFEPTGMTGTNSYEMDLDTPNLAIGYSREAGPGGEARWVNNLYKHVIKGGPAGGGFSTAKDLLRFDQAMRGGQLVSAATLELMWSAKPSSPAYGYGFQLDGAEGNRIVGHGGGFPGISSVLDIHLDKGYTVIALCNYDHAAVIISGRTRELLARVK